MKRFSLLLVATALVGGVWAQSFKEIHIFHTNDMHSRVEPYPDNFSDQTFAGKGGMERRANFMDAMRSKYGDVLLFDCGDFSQGTPYYNLFKGEAEVKIMNQLRYDAGTIGNHEFDFGLDNMAHLFRLANFPIVCANYDFTGTPVEGLVKDYVVLHRFGLKIGVFGLSPEMAGLVAKENYGATKFKDPFETANRVAAHLKKKEKCDIVICLSHLGWKDEPYCDIKLIENTRNIDLVLGGHSHSFFETPEYYKNLDGKSVPVQQMGKSAAYVGEMIVKLQKK